MMFTVVSVVLAVSVPAMADIEVECEADDGVCEETVTYEIQPSEDTGSEDQENIAEEPVIEGSDEECFPFCGLEWWPY